MQCTSCTILGQPSNLCNNQCNAMQCNAQSWGSRAIFAITNAMQCTILGQPNNAQMHRCTDAMQSWGSRAIQCTIVHRCSFECNAQLQYNLGAAEPVSSLRRHFVTNSLWFTSSLMMMMTMKTMMTNDDDNDDNDDDDK